jgi:site-specific DNA-cytosine methylase
MEQIHLFDLTKEKYKITKPIRLIELFGGIGSQAMALERLGVEFEHYRLVEFDKYPVKSYNAIHGTNFEPTDITKIDGDFLGITDKDKYEYIMTYSFPCFTKDTLILTAEGYKDIKNIKIGDKVLTHKKTYENVLGQRKTGHREIYKIKGMCFDELKTTENHKFYVRKMVRHYPTYANGKRGRIRTFNNPEWIECCKLNKSYYMGIAINQESVIPKWEGINYKWSDGRKDRHKNNLCEYMDNKDFWWLIGRYVGDGWLRTQGGIIICCAKDEIEEITEVANRLKFNYSVVEERTVYKIHFADKELMEFVKPIGKGATNKQIPGFIIDLPRDLLGAFVEGYVSADGCYTQNSYKTSSVSKKLSYGIAQCVAKVYQCPYKIYKVKRKKKTIIEGRKVNQKDSYNVVWKREVKKQDKAFYEDGYIWFPIQEVVNTKEKEYVYDIEVENHHSFTANGTIVHNCQDLSVAGKQKGMKKGSGTRSGLLWEVERLLNETEELPDVLLMENVPQVHSEDNKPDFRRWIDFLESKGYSNYYQDLNAKDYGVAQNRDRCFMVSILGDYFYKFPETIELDKTMKDYLEDEVDERYYINSEKAQKLIDTLIENGTLDRQTDRQTDS